MVTQFSARKPDHPSEGVRVTTSYYADEPLTVGSLCSGYGGLEMGLRLLGLRLRLAWVADNDPAASRLLAHRHPGVPNLGDISKVDWKTVERVALLAAGFPCTDISCAGRMAGLGLGTRSGVWAHVADAIAVIRPRFVVIENVEALLSTRANRNLSGAAGDLESGPAGMGDGADGPALRAIGAVLGDLADLGFDAEWMRVSASSVGAPHRRNRIFILAWPADAQGFGHGDARATSGAGSPATAVAGAAGSDSLSLLPTPNAALGRGTGFPSPTTARERMDRGTRCLDDAVALLPTPTAAEGSSGPGHSGRQGSPNLRTEVTLLPTPAARDAERGFGWGDQPGRPLSETIARLLPTPKSSDGDRRDSPAERARRSPSLVSVKALLPTPMAADAGTKRGSSAGNGLRNTSREIAAGALLPTPTAPPYGNNQSGSAGAAVRPSLDSLAAGGNLLPTPTVADADRWGQYADAIARWETVIGRPAPDPTEPGAKGKPRLSPRFVEWLMGLPEGHVTDLVNAADPEHKISRNDALRLLGNGVVPQQCAAAVAELLSHLSTPGRAA